MTRQFLLVPDTGPGFRYEADDVLMLVTVEKGFYMDFSLPYFASTEAFPPNRLPHFRGILTTIPDNLMKVDLVQRKVWFDVVLGKPYINTLESSGVFQLPRLFAPEKIEELRGDPDLKDYTTFELLFTKDSMEISDGTIWASLSREVLR